MSCLNIRNDYIFERLLKARQNKELVKVGEDHKKREYYYIGNEVFLRTNQEDDSFDLMELPVSREKSGNVAMVTVVPCERKIKFYAPLCSGFQVVIAEAQKKGIYWHYQNNASCFEEKETSLKYTIETLQEKGKFYGKNTPEYAEALERIITNVCDFNKEASYSRKKIKR
ncbi:MAG: hypothetical protein J6A52_00260 [Bacilli bacterium]|nr:hypothetical protein [Bacilli bacterium]